MNPIDRLDDLPEVDERIVILNCGTRWVTTLALMSALKVARSPVLLIDCESRDESREHFIRLANRYKLDFDWLDWPLRRHPAALDRLFRSIRAETVLLVDSDLEIVDSHVIDAMRDALRSRRECYGAGFAHGPHWMGEDHGMHSHAGIYAERMWIPCVLLRTRDIEDALGEGRSFADRRTFHDVNGFPLLSRMAAWRFKLPLLRRWPIHRAPRDVILDHFPSQPSAYGPSFVYYDTGADLHAWLKSREKSLAALPGDLWRGLHHYHGVTRATLVSHRLPLALTLRRDKDTVYTHQRDVTAEIKERLRTAYGVSLE